MGNEASDSVVNETVTKNQVVLLQLLHKESQKKVHVASVHIYWGKLERCDIQTLQICMAIRKLNEFMTDENEPVYVLAGDFNTRPHFPVYQMMQDKGPPNKSSLEMLMEAAEKSKFGQFEYTIKTLPHVLETNLKLASSYKQAQGSEPNITNCDDAALGKPYPLCLDYIWFSPETLDVAAVLQTPSDEAIFKHTALPSVLLPSDHLPLMAAFKFK